MLSYANTSAPWNTLPAHKTNYATQYAGLYFSRLATQRPKAFLAAKEAWPGCNIVPRILDVRSPAAGSGAAESNLIVIAGTVFLDMPLKPCILDVVAKESWVTAPPPRVKYTSDKDKVLLEDESGRLELVGNPIDDGFLVSGVVVALLGYENADNQFVVQDICYPRYSIERPVIDFSGDVYVAFVSGISIGAEFALELELQLFLDFISGDFADTLPSENASISRLIIAGNVFAKKNIPELTYAAGSMSKSNNEIYSPRSLTTVDEVLSQLSSSVHCDLMPGSEDPTNFAMPQRAMPSGLFPKSRGFSSFQLVSNPYSAILGGVRILGTSGQNIEDIFKFVESEDRLGIAERTLHWAHMAPTAPDTLPCYPFIDHDPFIIEAHPDVYFIGNQPGFATKMSTGPSGEMTRVILVPNFATTKSIALLNLRTKDCSKVSFAKI
ncbi:DNA polymerase delta subunit 2-like protein [Chytriomyces sp. MP71]|nr:DNA polymerase delta subunit 2-like protein [Chytriomyces sp. MP71]